MTLKNLLFEEQSKLVCTLKQHKKKCNVSPVPLCLIRRTKISINLAQIFVDFYFLLNFRRFLFISYLVLGLS